MRTISVVRDLGISLSSLCDQHGCRYRSTGVVLSSASWCGELDQGSQQRCRVGRASFKALGHELLVGALQSRKDGRRRRDETRTTVDDATAFSVSGGQDLEP